MARTADFRFTFYVRDWLSGTRQLTLEERGLYIDLIVMIYERRGRLRMPSEADFCRMLACDPRVLRRVLGRLVMLGKIEVKDNIITNARAADQIGLPESDVRDTSSELPEEVSETSMGSSAKVSTEDVLKQPLGDPPSKSSLQVIVNNTAATGDSAPPPPAAPPPLGRPVAERPEPSPAEALARAWGDIRNEVWPEAGALGWCVNADDIGTAAMLIQQGVDVPFALAVVKAKCEALKASGNGARNRLSWFSGAISDARARAASGMPAPEVQLQRGAPRVVPMAAPNDLWRPRILGFQRDPKSWLTLWGRSPWHSAGAALAVEILGPMPAELAAPVAEAVAAAPAVDPLEIPAFLKRQAPGATS